MITDEEFSALIAEAAAAIPEPMGADAILAAARVDVDPTSVPSPIAKARSRSRGFAISALGVAASLAILITVAVSWPSSPSRIAHTSLAPTLKLAGSGFGTAGAPDAAGTTQSSESASTGSTESAGSQEIVTTGTLSLVVDKSALGHVVAELQAIATSLGGYVSASSVALAGPSRGGTVVLGVPARDSKRQ